MDIERIHSLLGSRKSFMKRPDGWWLDDDGLDARIAAAVMLGEGARLVTVTAVPVSGTDCRLIYHWDIGGEMINLGIGTRGGRIESIAGLTPAADWIEREIREYYAVEFDGRGGSDPLLLRPGDKQGFMRKGGGRGGADGTDSEEKAGPGYGGDKGDEP